MDILVFKTNLSDPSHLQVVQSYMQGIPGINRWNVDIQDCDHVLRIEASMVSPRFIEQALQSAGYLCEELPD
jgi:hypothetical protein